MVSRQEDDGSGNNSRREVDLGRHAWSWPGYRPHPHAKSIRGLCLTEGGNGENVLLIMAHHVLFPSNKGLMLTTVMTMGSQLPVMDSHYLWNDCYTETPQISS
jgi:hypothetical protein